MLRAAEDKITLTCSRIIRINRKVEVAFRASACCCNTVCSAGEKGRLEFSILTCKDHCAVALSVRNKRRSNIFGCKPCC